MMPFFETVDGHKHLCVVDLIVAFDQGEALGEERNQMPFVVFLRLLGEDRTSCKTRCVHFESKGEVEDWSQSDERLQLKKGTLLGWSPDEPDVFQSEVMEGSRVMGEV